MERPLYGFILYPQGVAHVTLALRNASDIAKAFNAETIHAHCNVIGTIAKRYATACKLPQRIITDATKCVVFHFDGFAEDDFGNVRAYYKFSIDVEMVKGDGSITLADTTPQKNDGNGTTQ